MEERFPNAFHVPELIDREYPRDDEPDRAKHDDRQPLQIGGRAISPAGGHVGVVHQPSWLMPGIIGTRIERVITSAPTRVSLA